MTCNQKPVVHVVFGMSAAGSLRQAIAQLKLDQTVIGLPDDLSFGPINPPTSELRAKWIEDILGYDNFEEYGQRSDLFWSQATDYTIAPIVLVCRRSAQEYSGFLEFLWKIGNYPFRVVDITEVEFVTPQWRSGPPTWISPTFGYIDHTRIISAGLIDRQSVLDEQQIAAYREMWKRRRAENAPFRVVSDQGLSSAPITHFDGVLSSCVTAEWRKSSLVVSEAIGRLEANRFDQCGDLVLWSRVRALANEGIFEMKGDGSVMRNSVVRLAS